jgi:hypothetical protein
MSKATPSSFFYKDTTGTIGTTTEYDGESQDETGYNPDDYEEPDDDELLSINAANGSGSGSCEEDDDCGRDRDRHRDRDENLNPSSAIIPSSSLFNDESSSHEEEEEEEEEDEDSIDNNNESMRARAAMLSEYSVAEDTTFDFDDTTTVFTTRSARLMLRHQQQGTHQCIDEEEEEEDEEEEDEEDDDESIAEEEEEEDDDEDNIKVFQTTTSFFTSNAPGVGGGGGGNGSVIQKQEEPQQEGEDDELQQQQQQQQSHQEEWKELLLEQQQHVSQTTVSSSSSSEEQQQDETMSLNTIGSSQLVKRKLQISKEKMISAQHLLQQTATQTQKQKKKSSSSTTIKMIMESITSTIKPLLEIFTIIGVGWMLWPEIVHHWNNNSKNSNNDTRRRSEEGGSGEGRSSTIMEDVPSSFQSIQHRGGYQQQQKQQQQQNQHQQMKSVLDEKEDLMKEIQKLQSEIEWKNKFRRDVVMVDPSPMKRGGYSSNHQQKLLNTFSSLSKTTTKIICNEVDLVLSCWSIIIFGICIFTALRLRKRGNTKKSFPIHRTAVTTFTYATIADKFLNKEIFPVVDQVFKDHTAPDSMIGKTIEGMQRSIEANVGSVRDFVEGIVTAIYGLFHTVILEMILPILVESTKQSIRYVRIFVLAVSAPSSTSQAVEAAVTTLPKDVIITELKNQIKYLTENLRMEEYQHDSLKETMVSIEGTMKGQDNLLYEERMKGRSWRLQYNQMKQELQLYQESQERRHEEIRNEATESTAIENQRLRHEFLNEHIRRRILETRIDVHGNGTMMAVTATASIDTLACARTTMNGGGNDKYDVLPEPILQSFSHNLYKNHILSNVSSDCSSLTKDTGPPRCGSSGDDAVGVDVCHNRGDNFDGECRDDSVERMDGGDAVDSKNKDDEEHDYLFDQLEEQILNNYNTNNNNNSNNSNTSNSNDAVICEQFIAQSKKSTMMWPQPSSSAASRFASHHANRHSFMTAAMPTIAHTPLFSPFLMVAATTTTNSNVSSKNNNSSHIRESGSPTNLMALPFECCRGQEEEIRE